MKIDIIFAPQQDGVGVGGFELLPQSLTGFIKPSFTILRDSNIVSKKRKNIKNLEAVIDYTNRLASVVSSIISTGGFPLTIGGDHSVSLGTVSGVTENIHNLGVIWIDAHGDMNTETTSPSKNIHGMPLAALQGKGNSKLINAYFKGVKIKTSNIVIYGVRDLDEKEQELMEEIGVRYVSFEEIENRGIDITISEAINYLKERTNNLHVSFDLDVLNPQFIPGVSTPVKNGLLPQNSYSILDKCFSNFNVTSFDIVEFNPALDKRNQTRNFIIELTDYILKKVA